MATQALGRDGARPDRKIDSDPEHEVLLRWWVCPVGAVDDLKPARGETLPGDADGSPFGYTVESVRVSSRDEATVFLVTQYVKPKVTATVGDLGELKRRITKRTHRGDTGVRRFVGAEDTIEDEVAVHLPLYSAWPGGGEEAWHTSLAEVRIDHDERPDISYVTATYRPLTHRGWLERNPGKGILKVAFLDRQRRSEYDLDDHPMELVMDRAGDGDGLPGQDDEAVRRWHVVEGDYERIRGAGLLLRVEVVVVSPPLAEMARLIGCVNDSALSAFGALGAEGYLLFLTPDPPAEQVYRNASLMRLNLNLAWIGKKWNESVVTELQEAKALEIPVYDDEGNETGRTRDLLAWPAVDGVERHDCKIAEPADLGFLDEYLGYSS